MRTHVDESLKDDAARWRFRFACEACAYFAPDSGSCANGYPNQNLRGARLAPGRWLEFCKEFELA